MIALNQWSSKDAWRYIAELLSKHNFEINLIEDEIVLTCKTTKDALQKAKLIKDIPICWQNYVLVEKQLITNYETLQSALSKIL